MEMDGVTINWGNDDTIWGKSKRADVAAAKEPLLDMLKKWSNQNLWMHIHIPDTKFAYTGVFGTPICGHLWDENR
jgi:hypothetical protein